MWYHQGPSLRLKEWRLLANVVKVLIFKASWHWQHPFKESGSKSYLLIYIVFDAVVVELKIEFETCGCFSKPCHISFELADKWQSSINVATYCMYIQQLIQQEAGHIFPDPPYDQRCFSSWKKTPRTHYVTYDASRSLWCGGIVVLQPSLAC